MKCLARWLRRLADRIDHEGAPKAIHWSFTFEDRRGIVFREDGRGCPLWYYGDADYERAHTEADSAPGPFRLPPEGGTFPIDQFGFVQAGGEPIGGTVTFTPTGQP